jgi:ATP-dependent Clp protease ATP-binding subunit ClpC
MFERYTIPARRCIFFTLFEAKVFGSHSIESEHLLLGILHENQALVNRLLDTHDASELIRQRIEARATIREMITTSEDLPLTEECEHVLTNAAEEADRVGQKEIEPLHLMFGLLKEEKCLAAEILGERGLTLAQVSEDIQGLSGSSSES